jgi:hypothetical protein
MVRIFGSRRAGWAEHEECIAAIKFFQPIFKKTTRK